MTRPPPPATATRNLFCSRALVAGAGAGGAPQVGPGRRGPIGAPSPAHSSRCRRRRPAPSPPLPLALPRPGLCRRHPRSTPGLRGGAGGALAPGGSRPPGSPILRARTAAAGARGRGLGPGCGLWRVQARRRRDAAAAITTGRDQAPRPAFPAATARPRVLAARGSPSRRPARPGVGGRWRPASGSYGARRLPLHPDAGRRGALGSSGLSPRPGLAPPRPGVRQLARGIPVLSPARLRAAPCRGRRARSPARAGPGRGLGASPLPGCGRAAPAGKLTCPPPRRSARRRGAASAPLGRICLPPGAQRFAMTVPCL